MRILSPAIVFLLLFTACTNSQILICARVIDGDTIVLSNGEKVRLIGVDTPETKHSQKPVEYYGKEATAFTKKMVGGKVVKLKYDVQRRDEYDRLLAYVYLMNGTFLNAEIIKQQCIERVMAQYQQDQDAEKALQRLANSLTNKILHGPTIEMRKALKSDDQATIQFLKSLISPD